MLAAPNPVRLFGTTPFLFLLRKREPGSLELWLSTAQKSGLPEVVEFARGLRRDKDAEMGALIYKGPNGLTEGHVNRLKIIKRSAYGRASAEEPIIRDAMRS